MCCRTPISPYETKCGLGGHDNFFLQAPPNPAESGTGAVRREPCRPCGLPRGWNSPSFKRISSILQEEEGAKVEAVAEGSEEEFKNNRHLYGVRCIRNVGYGMWQHAARATLS